MELDARSLMVTQMELRDSEDTPWVILAHTPGDEVGGAFLPSTTVLDIVATGLKLTLDFSEWQGLDASPIPFTLSAPEGVEVQPLEELAEKFSKSTED